MFDVIIDPKLVKGIFVPTTHKQLFTVLNRKHRDDHIAVVTEFREKADKQRVQFHMLTEIFDFDVLNEAIINRIGDDKVLRLVTPTGDFVGFAVI